MARMNVRQVKEARVRAWRGESARAIAESMALSNQIVWCAIRGKTWSSIKHPPPIPDGLLRKHRKRPTRTCCNCGKEYKRNGTTIRCGACTTYFYRFGTERRLENLGKWYHARVSRKDLLLLHERYMAGSSIDELADKLPFSAETLRRRFSEAGLEMRTCAGTRLRLTPGIVYQARKLVHEEGIPISVVAEKMGINYCTLHSAVRGDTWRSAGGPLPEIGTQEKRPCRRCEMLTAHSSGLCRFCRVGGKEMMKEEK